MSGVGSWEGVGAVRTWQEKYVQLHIVKSVELPTDPLCRLVPRLLPGQGVVLLVQAGQGQLLHLQGRRSEGP